MTVAQCIMQPGLGYTGTGFAYAVQALPCHGDSACVPHLSCSALQAFFKIEHGWPRPLEPRIVLYHGQLIWYHQYGLIG
jgi:hypothetical protein